MNNDTHCNHKYDEIINLPPHTSSFHRPMPLYDRAAQFVPFAALTGHDKAIEETARLTLPRHELSADETNGIMRHIREAMEKSAPVRVIHYIADTLKEGGIYATTRGMIKRIDEYEAKLILLDGAEISLSDIFSLTLD